MAIPPAMPNVEPTMDFGDFLHSDFCSSSPQVGADHLNQANKIDQDKEDLGYNSESHTTHEQYDCMDDLLEEAAQHYGTEKPTFCVLNKGEQYRTVRLAENLQEVRLVFRQWPKSEYGFWVYTELNGDKYIVKCDGGRYFVWQGLRSGFSAQPVAQVCSVRPQAISPPDFGNRDVGSDTPSAHSLRKRTARQQKPYTMYNLQQQTEKRGIPVTEAQLEAHLISSGSKKRKVTVKNEPRAVPSANNTAQLSSHAPQRSTPVSSGDASSATVQHPVVEVDVAHLARAILRTRLNSFEGPSIPVYLSGIKTCDELFDRLWEKWAFKLEGRRINYCIIKFSWLDGNRNLFLQDGDEDGYKLILDEFKDSEQWNSTGLVNADLDIRTIPKDKRTDDGSKNLAA